MNDEKKKDSNELLNFLMIIIGLLFILKAVMELLAWADIYTPEWLSGTGVDAALSVFGSQGIISLLLGFWCLVAGIGLFREEEYALGMGLVVLSIMAAAGITAVMGWISAPDSFDAGYWPSYITIVATIVGVLGFLWLLFTYKRYD
ncbi:hypothetical protein LCGC14_0681360 [marine sediment metagenome]|uniref:Major facilitator superfamily (MFS) profile domain-containing protein n=1 Tax=marine sediment metagenome TaxID=412755 RepID=A0A0F9TW58_9ZZZZ|nr:MAG: hypothetical protein Lokiarch_26370 [Candidatus Lokiarchaeum sp. GC14_75]